MRSPVFRSSRRSFCSGIVVTLVAAGAISAPASAVAAIPLTTVAAQATPRPVTPLPGARFIGGAAATAGPALPSGERLACPPPSRPGQMQCMSIVRTRAGRTAAARLAAPVLTASRPFGLSPASLRAAYGLVGASATRGRGMTIAIVDAFSDPRAASDLARYRRYYGLGGCPTSNGCLRIVNEHGKSGPLPHPNRSWAVEESLDLDMASAICPHCRILLVEASSNLTTDLGIAEGAAVTMGARFASNSWSGPEFTDEQAFDHDFNHPGVAITFASGDSGYGAAYPTDIQYVTAVGGTTLRRASNPRGWSETVWSGTGSGCSSLAAKAPWQKSDDSEPNGCLNRTGNDVAADANPYTGASVYDSYRSGGTWLQVGGTSEATPIIAAVYALAGKPAPGTYPAQYPYLRPFAFHKVTSGHNGRCEPNRAYLCHGVHGYNGPTGLGTPAGTAGFASGGGQRVTLLDPGVQDVQAGTAFSLSIAGLDTRGAARSLSYSASGLPAGLSIAPAPGSTDGEITGTLPSAPATSAVTVHATDPSTGRTASVSFRIVSVPSLTGTAVTGWVNSSQDALCMDAGAGVVGTVVSVTSCAEPDPAASQEWAYVPTGTPGGTGELANQGLCLGVSAGQGVLADCSGTATDWLNLGLGMLQNSATGMCLAIPALDTIVNVDTAPCAYSLMQSWGLPEGLVTSGTGGCLGDPGGSMTIGTQATLAACDPSQPGQLWDWQWNEWLTVTNTLGAPCLVPSGGSSLDGAREILGFCSNDASSDTFWLTGPGGELINSLTGKCLADPGGGGPGTGLVQKDCYGEPGEIWAVN